jgi:hypothetical protein
MRTMPWAALTAAAATLIACGAQAAPQMAARGAPSVQAYATQATYQGPAFNVGYSAKARRMTACLASYPGVYDPRTDLVRVRPGVTRRCSL